MQQFFENNIYCPDMPHVLNLFYIMHPYHKCYLFIFSDSVLEKSTTKRQLSAPEYLEKRKQERRKSELNLNRTLKLKKTLKKV